MNRRPFRLIFFDITGNCNGRCPYCLTGNRGESGRKMIAPDVFGRVLDRLRSEGLADADSVVGLYNWGEPLLHPDFPGIVAALNARGLRYAISTNGSIHPDIGADTVRCLDRIIFSMPGFSQSSYDRINRLPFDRVRENIGRMTREVRKNGFRGEVGISYHVYQFNVDEMPACEAFARREGIAFNPTYAILNDWRMLHGWLDGTLPAEEMRRISEDLFCSGIRETMKRSPASYACPQHEYLVIDEDAHVVVCCQTPKEADYFCGNLLTDDIATVLARKRDRPVCGECIRSGLAYYLNHAIVRPRFYRDPAEGRGTVLASFLRRLGSAWRGGKTR